MENAATVNDACRLCDKNSEQMHSIFAKNETGQQVLCLIKECLPVIVYRTDPLSKKICDVCYGKLETFFKFKSASLATASRHREHLQNGGIMRNKRIQLYLSLEKEVHQEMTNSSDIPPQASKGTSTDDLKVSCINCKSTSFDSNAINSEVELCAELHQAIAESLGKNKVVTASESEKPVRTRRRRSQPFYNELDDSLCSSLTEYANTESSQCYDEYHSEVESYESDSEDTMERIKRRKLNHSDAEMEVRTEVPVPDTTGLFKHMYSEEVECRYYPLSLMSLALNVVNKIIVPDYEPDEFYEKEVEPSCTYCKQQFKNSKLLALHEIDHISIEMGDKVDSSVLWHESRDDAHIRNRWLSSYDEQEDEVVEDNQESLICNEADKSGGGESLLIPVGTEAPQEQKLAGEIVLIKTKPTVNGVALTDYSKEERKAFYRTMRIGGVNKKFCSLCRYSFKDNWAIESHYFSSACYYTCRYCGMRFNKQRPKFEEHVQEHEDRGDPLSTSIYAANKVSNFVPKVIQPDKVKHIVEQHNQEPPKPKNIARRSVPMNPIIKIKEEKMDVDDELPQFPTQKMQATPKTNQAYFCRKCYKVFFKLDEFNIHSKNCDYNQFPQNKTKLPNTLNINGEMLSPTGRPMRHCVRDAGPYRDEAYIPESVLKEKTPPSPSTQSFVCFICNTPFPTIYSRNSHMRIHKGEANNTNRSPVVNQKPKQNHLFEQIQMFNNFVKQEPLEPEVQIHESEQQYSANNLVGSVSITPISRNPNQKATINPNIMKLVQNNPHLTIKANRSPERAPAPSASNFQNMADLDKSYKCSSCWEAFSNKSHLYFHKKNQCEGSKYPCPFCKKRFGTEAAYSSHIFYSHPE